METDTHTQGEHRVGLKAEIKARLQRPREAKISGKRPPLGEWIPLRALGRTSLALPYLGLWPPAVRNREILWAWPRSVGYFVTATPERSTGCLSVLKPSCPGPFRPGL